VDQCFSEKQFLKIPSRQYCNWLKTIRTEKGPRQRLIVSIGTYLKIPKEKRREVACIVKEKLWLNRNWCGKLTLFLPFSRCFTGSYFKIKKVPFFYS
jgi:hypothetical protein